MFASLKKLAKKFEPAQIVRKSTQANAAHRKLVVKRGTSRHKLKLAMNSVLVRSDLYKLKNIMPGHGGNHPTGMLALPNVLLTECYPVSREIYDLRNS